MNATATTTAPAAAHTVVRRVNRWQDQPVTATSPQAAWMAATGATTTVGYRFTPEGVGVTVRATASGTVVGRVLPW